MTNPPGTHDDRSVDDLIRALFEEPDQPLRPIATPQHACEVFRVDAGTEASPYAIAATADGALWVTLIDASAVLRLHPTQGRRITTLPRVDHQGDREPRPAQITPDGDSVWLACMGDDTIRHIDRNGTTTAIPLTPGSAPYGICIAVNGEVWYTASGTARIGHLRNGVDPIEVQAAVADSFPSMITADAEGRIRYTMNAADAVGIIHPDGAHTTLEALPTPGGPVGIAAARAQTWVALILDDSIAQITGETVHHHRLPSGSRPHAITLDSSGNCWATLWGADSVVRITPDGARTTVDLPPGSEPHGLTFDRHDNLWVALESGHLARLAPHTVPADRAHTEATRAQTEVLQ